VALNGAGHLDNDFIACLMIRSISVNGHYSFHYNEALGDVKHKPRLLITSWDEIP